jgi:hypothetical protein
MLAVQIAAQIAIEGGVAVTFSFAHHAPAERV